MKGIAILLMMLSHLVFPDGLVKQFIYSFHMPLFFILAGIFAKDISTIPSFLQFTNTNAKRLILPYVVTFMFLCILGAIKAISKSNVSIFLRQLLSMLLASADGWQSPWGMIYAGPIWFLVSLFWVRQLFYGIQYICTRVPKYRDELILCISISLSICAVLTYPLLPAFHFSILQAFCAVAFYALGWYIHRHPLPWWICGISIVVWPFAIRYGYVDLSWCRMNTYPLSFVGACGGTYAIYILSRGIAYIHKFANSLIHSFPNSFLAWCGMYSLPILCMHTFEMSSGTMYSIKPYIFSICELPWGGVIAITFAWIIIRMPYFKNVYR